MHEVLNKKINQKSLRLCLEVGKMSTKLSYLSGKAVFSCLELSYDPNENRDNPSDSGGGVLKGPNKGALKVVDFVATLLMMATATFALSWRDTGSRILPGDQ